jgi:hypothetical protein
MATSRKRNSSPYSKMVWAAASLATSGVPAEL